MKSINGILSIIDLMYLDRIVDNEILPIGLLWIMNLSNYQISSHQFYSFTQHVVINVNVALSSAHVLMAS